MSRAEGEHSQLETGNSSVSSEADTDGTEPRCCTWLACARSRPWLCFISPVTTAPSCNETRPPVPAVSLGRKGILMEGEEVAWDPEDSTLPTAGDDCWPMCLSTQSAVTQAEACLP